MLTSIVAGLKGGTGKSLYAVALIDYLRARDLPVLVVETDTGNPDVADVYGKRQGERLRVERCALEDAYGWRELVAHLADHRGYAVVNMGGGNLPSIGLGVREGYYDQIATLGPYVTWWLMTSEAVTVEQLGSYLRVAPTHPVHVVANAGSDQPGSFPFVVEGPPAPYVDQLLRSDLESIRTIGSKLRRGGGGELYVPRLAEPVAIKMRNEELDLRGVQEVVDDDDREAAREWTEVVHARITRVLGDTPSATATAPRAEHETATSVVVAREPGPESAPGEREDATAACLRSGFVHHRGRRRRFRCVSNPEEGRARLEAEFPLVPLRQLARFVPRGLEPEGEFVGRLSIWDFHLLVDAAKAAAVGASKMVVVGKTGISIERWAWEAAALWDAIHHFPDVVVRRVVEHLRLCPATSWASSALSVVNDATFHLYVDSIKSAPERYRFDQSDAASGRPVTDGEIFLALLWGDFYTLPSASQLQRVLPCATDELERLERGGDEP